MRVIAARREAAGLPPPEELAAMSPDRLWPGNRQAWWAWHDLSGSRGLGMAAGPIPLSEIEAWFRLMGKAPDWWLITKIQTVDNAWMEQQTSKSETRRQEAAANQSGKKNGR